MIEEVELLDILEVCSDFLTDPSDEKNIKAMTDIKSKLVIRPYLTLKQKEIVLAKTIKDIQMIDREVFTYAANVEISLTFNALIAYTNINSDFSAIIKDYDFYDLLWASGICDYIVKFCEQDYHRLCDLIYHMLSYENLFDLMGVLKSFDTKSIDELTNEFRRFRLDTKPESLIALGNIAANNDPTLFTIKTMIDNEAIDVAKKADKKDGE